MPRTAHTKKTVSNEFFGLLVGTYVSCTLLLIRMIFSGNSTFFFMFWNLFLAWVPFVLSELISQKSHVLLKRPLFLLGFGMSWLIFFPNAPYILTDLKHLQYMSHVPLWFDVLMLSSFGFNGLYLGLYSLSHIHEIIDELYGKKWAWFLIGIIAYLTSFGLYLGRILRWNSWDIVTRPYQLLSDVFIRVFNPSQYSNTHLIIALVAVGSFLIYRVFYNSFAPKKLGNRS